MIRALLVLVVAALTVAGGGCAQERARSTVFDPVPHLSDLPPLLTWLGEFTRPAGAIYPQLTESARFGSVSGLVFDPKSGEWIGAIDDRQGSRLASLSITYSNAGLQVAPTRMTELRPAKGISERVVTQADLEAITALPDGTFLVSEEGHRTRDGGIWQPVLMQVTREGLVTGVFSFPDEYRISADGLRGIRENQGFEALTRTPNGRVIAGLEQPMIEHGVTTFDRAGDGRLVEFEYRRRSWRPGRQWRYEISPTPRVEGFPDLCTAGENGLVELLATSDTTLIALERACLQDLTRKKTANTVRLFAVELVGTDTKKTLLLDLSDLSSKLSSDLQQLENFEALAFGPVIGGARTLLVASDDNFRATQRTSFLLFGLRY